MKRIIPLFLTIAIGLMLVGCDFVSSAYTGLEIGAERMLSGEGLQGGSFSSEAEAGSNSESSVVEEASKASDAEKEKNNGETQRVGNDRFGYIDLPLTWEQGDASGNNDDIVYVDRINKAVLAMNIKNNKADLPVAAEAIRIATGIAGYKNITMSETELGNQKAFKIYGDEDKEDTKIISWVIKKGDEILNINILAKPGKIETIAAIVEETYSFSK